MRVLADAHEQTRFSSCRKAGWDGVGPPFTADKEPRVTVGVCAAGSPVLWVQLLREGDGGGWGVPGAMLAWLVEPGPGSFLLLQHRSLLHFAVHL